jgi:hypothetical protein
MPRFVAVSRRLGRASVLVGKTPCTIRRTNALPQLSDRVLMKLPKVHVVRMRRYPLRSVIDRAWEVITQWALVICAEIW